MHVRFSQTVVVAAEAWGEVSGLIIDPQARRVTALVVEPPGRHEQARLAPVERAHVSEDQRVVLSVGSDELRRLPLVRDSTFQRPSRPVLPGRDWDVGIRHTPGEPSYSFRNVPRAEFDDERTVEIVFDRIPKQTIELRAESGFELAGGEEVGRVAGLILDSEWMVSQVLVLRQPRILRHVVAVPGAEVVRYETDRVISSLAPDAFAALPRDPARRRR